MGTLVEVEHGRLDNGGMLEDAVLFHFDGDSCDDCPLPDSFKDLAAVDFILGFLGCDGSMTDFEFLRNEMMKNDDIYEMCMCVGFEEKSIGMHYLIGFVRDLKMT